MCPMFCKFAILSHEEHQQVMGTMYSGHFASLINLPSNVGLIHPKQQLCSQGIILSGCLKIFLHILQEINMSMSLDGGE